MTAEKRQKICSKPIAGNTLRVIVVLLGGLFALPLFASNLDFGVGFGFYHKVNRYPDPIPALFDSRSGGLSDFGTPVLEFGIPLSETIKLSLKATYSHRVYEMMYRNREFQNMGQYIDLPLSLGLKVQRVEVYAGVNYEQLVAKYVFNDDFHFDEAEVSDAKARVYGVHLGTRMALGKTDKTALDFYYSHDLIPYSEVWSHHVFQNRYVLLLTHRFITEDKQQDIFGVNRIEEKIQAAVGDLDVGVNFGFTSATLKTEGKLNEVGEFDYRKTHYVSGIDAGYKLGKHSYLQTRPHLNTRTYSIEEASDSRRRFNATSQYLDIPLMVKSKAGGIDWGIGASAAILLNSTYEREYTLSYGSELEDAADFIPGYCAMASIPIPKSKRMAFNILYTWDLQPFSSTYGFNKTQRNISYSLSYNFITHQPMQDIVPENLLKDLTQGWCVQAGVKNIEFDHKILLMPYARLGKLAHADKGIGYGYAITGGAMHYRESKYVTLNASRLAYQKQFSYAKWFLEPYVAPGIGMDLGIVTNTQDYVTDPGFPMYPYANLLFIWEAGIRFNISKPVSLVVFTESNSTAFYGTGWHMGIGLSANFNKLRFGNLPKL